MHSQQPAYSRDPPHPPENSSPPHPAATNAPPQKNTQTNRMQHVMAALASLLHYCIITVLADKAGLCPTQARPPTTPIFTEDHSVRYSTTYTWKHTQSPAYVTYTEKHPCSRIQPSTTKRTVQDR